MYLYFSMQEKDIISKRTERQESWADTNNEVVGH